MKTQMLVFCVFLCGVHLIKSARILGVVIFPSYSHNAPFIPIWKELVNRGHEVVSITTFPISNSSIQNLTEIDCSFAQEMWINKRSILKPSIPSLLTQDFQILHDINERIFQLPQVRELLNQKFDLVIAEWLYPAVFAFSTRLSCPLIGISTLQMLDVLSKDMGNPIYPVVHPNFFVPSTDDNQPDFFERINRLQSSIWLNWFYQSTVYPNSDRIVKQYLGQNLPPVREIIENVSAVFVNNNFLFGKPKPYLPNIVDFSGVHIQDPKPLPMNIQSFLDRGTNGVIYFSFGSNIRSHVLSKELKAVFIETFTELPYSVIWKFEENINGSFKHIMASKWLPQSDILNHKNVKLFITQGGLQSMEEAIRRRVPVIGLPFTLDQPRNIKKMETMGIGIYLEKSTVTKDLLKKSIIEIMENVSYRNKIDKVADLVEDEPMKSLDKLIWWIEHVIRTKGATHLRSSFLSIPMYQVYCLDIIAALLLIILLCVYLSVIAYKKIICFVENKYKVKVH